MKNLFLEKNSLSLFPAFKKPLSFFSVDEAIPVFSFSKYQNFTISNSNVLTGLYKISRYDRIEMTKLFDKLEEGMSVQLYSSSKENEKNYFISFSLDIDFTADDDNSITFLTSFSNHQIKREMKSFITWTEQSISKINECINDFLLTGFLEPLPDYNRLIQLFSSFKYEGNRYINTVNNTGNNASYLKIGEKQYALVIELASLEPVANNQFFGPGPGLDSVSYSGIHYLDKNKSRKKTESLYYYSRFQREFSKNKQSEDSFMTRKIEGTQLLKSQLKNIRMSHQVLLKGNSITELKQKTDEYISSLNKANVSINATIINAKKRYLSFFPGNFGYEGRGHFVGLNVLPALLWRLHGK